MKDTELKIAQSEAEWRRYRSENIGVRESVGQLCGALKRSLRKRIFCVVRNIGPWRSRSDLMPSYDAGRVNIVVSLTTTKSRIRYIFPVLYSIAGQSRKPDLVVLWLEKHAAYPQKTIAGIRAMGVRIKFRKDLGPHTKYYYAFQEYPKDVVITVDDDIFYHEQMIEELYGTYLRHRDCVIARRVNKIRFDRKKELLKYSDWIWEYRDAKEPAHDLLATGVGGVLYPPEVLYCLCRQNTDFLKVCPKNDDIWLKFCELSGGIKVCAVHNTRNTYDVIRHKSQKTSLAAENVDQGKNDEQFIACAEYFGMSDDLCERVLS